MNPRALLLLSIAAAAFALDPPPKTEVKPVTDTLHGVSITDPYRWLEDQDSPQTRAWIDEQVKYTESFLATLPGRDKLQKDLEPYFRVDAVGSPTVRGGRYFFSRRLAGENRASIIVRDALKGADRVLVDPNQVSADQSVSVQSMGPTMDGLFLAYAVRQGGEDEVEVRFRDVRTGADLPDRLPRARYFGVAWRKDGKGVWYSRLFKDGATPLGTKIQFHEMGTPLERDKFVFARGKGILPTDNVSISEDGRYLLLTVNYGTSSKHEVRFIDLESGGDVVTVVNGIDAQFRPAILNNRMYLWTNWLAPNWRLLAVDLDDPHIEEAKEIIVQRDMPLSGVSFVGGRIFADYLENVKTKIYQFNPDGKPLGELAAPGLGVTSLPRGRWESSEAFFDFNSFTEPDTSYRLDIDNGSREVWFRPKLPDASERLETEQVWFKSKDGTRVPMWLVHKKGLKLDGDRPVLLSGYGGFNISELPSFSPNAILWADAGGIFALPNLRGGGEFGEKWHQAAMFANKQNTFDDFIAAAEFLIKSGYTKPSRIAIRGGSNGGLLVGALLTQRPDLVGAALCGVPLLDMLRYDKFLLGKFWISEYGTADDPEQFKYIYKYSPYQHVQKGARYPAVMFLSGDSDTRVAPLHARKMTALMQASTGSGKPIILHYDTKAGHSGGKPVAQQIKDSADELLFLMTQVGVTP
jgi:prolyl oligopeptidase